MLKLGILFKEKRMDWPMVFNNSFLKEIDFTKEELTNLIDLGLKFKRVEKKKLTQ